MTIANNQSEGFHFLILQGVLPIQGSQVPAEIIAGLTLAALAIPEVMGCTKIAGTSVITGIEPETDFIPLKSATTLARIGLKGDFGFHVGGYILTSNKRSIRSCSGVGVLF